jgi:peptide/nickel transport system permease protein
MSSVPPQMEMDPAAPANVVAADSAIRQKRSPAGRVMRALPFVWLGVILVLALFGSVISGHSPNTPSADILLAPGRSHLMGTDELGRDIFTRVAVGAGTSVKVAGLAVLIGLLAGGFLGVAAASSHRIVDGGIMRSMDVLLAFPAIVLALMVSLLLGQALVFVSILIGVVISPHIARLVRNRLVSELRLGYVTAERSTGASLTRIQLVHVSRNVVAPIGAYCLLLFADSMLFEAALSYVGVGIQPPTASWGNMILEGQKLLIANAWWVSVFPGLFLFLTVAVINILGDRWVAEFDPLLRQRA